MSREIWTEHFAQPGRGRVKGDEAGRAHGQSPRFKRVCEPSSLKAEHFVAGRPEGQNRRKATVLCRGMIADTKSNVEESCCGNMEEVAMRKWNRAGRAAWALKGKALGTMGSGPGRRLPGRGLNGMAVVVLLTGLSVWGPVACSDDSGKNETDAAVDQDVNATADGALRDASGADRALSDAGQADASQQQDAAGPGDDIPTGTVLFSEPFEDTDFSSRGWYDSPSATLSTTEHVSGSTASFECTFEQGARGCSGGTPGRHHFDETDRLYVSFWVKFSENWVGSGKPYHPHVFYFVTNEDDQWVGPANTHLTCYIEWNHGYPRIALQDSRNVDQNCILRNDDSFVGCNGDFDSYPFTEDRSACSCNGILGDLDERDCYNTGSYWYSARGWRSTEQVFGDNPGPNDKTQWHFVETYFELNSIQNGVGVPDGKIRLLVDGRMLVNSDSILFRTGVHETMRFNQFLVGPYIGDGSPVTQTMWVDDLTVATGRPQ